MSHTEDLDLALASLEGPADTATACTCGDCQAALKAYQRTVDAGRAGLRLERPAPAVWDRIAATITAEGSSAPVAESRPDGIETTHLPPPVDLDGRRSTRRAATRGRPHTARSPRRWSLVGLVAASVAVGIFGTVAIQQFTSPDPSEELAATELDPLPGWDAAGTAVVEQTGTRRELIIDLPEPPVEGYREVWLIDRDVKRLISLGILTSDQGRFTVPSDVDLDDFPIVDVSDEPLDGDPAHSGDSIVRGELT